MLRFYSGVMTLIVIFLLIKIFSILQEDNSFEEVNLTESIDLTDLFLRKPEFVTEEKLDNTIYLEQIESLRRKKESKLWDELLGSNWYGLTNEKGSTFFVPYDEVEFNLSEIENEDSLEERDNLDYHNIEPFDKFHDTSKDTTLTIPDSSVFYNFDYFDEFQDISNQAHEYVLAHKNDIIKYANRYNVPATAIAGIISVESTLNSDELHNLENYYIENFFLTNSDKRISKLIEDARANGLFSEKRSWMKKIKNPAGWSLGICQMTIDVAIKTDLVMATLENRSRLSNKDLFKELLIPESNIKYTALYLKTIKDRYLKELQIDLFEEPSLLVTIYNLGNIDRLISRRKSIKRNSSIHDLENNVFGAFCKFHEETIHSLISE